jgi:CubicO group peptidase (beta-lactamase class C family)
MSWKSTNHSVAFQVETTAIVSGTKDRFSRINLGEAVPAPASFSRTLRAWHFAAGVLIPLTMAIAFTTAATRNAAQAAEPDPVVEARIQAAIPEIETYIADGMKAFDVPGLAIGIVANDKLVYAKGFGVRSRPGGQSVDPHTVFQIGSTTKGFLATTIALMVDRGKLHWDDRVVDLYPSFQLKDPWVTREFRVYDLLAQRSGLLPYANDALGILGLEQGALIGSLRYVEPVSSFRSTFAYTNVTHMLAGRIVAKAAGASDWNAVLQQELLTPLGMKESSYTAAAIEAAPNHATGYRWTPQGSVEAPFTQIFPYDFDGAGDLNSSVEDVAHWVRLQLGNGMFEGNKLVSAENLGVTRTPKVGISERSAYALGWVISQTANGTIVWHNGGTSTFGALIGLVPGRNAGVIVFTNETNIGFPDAVGLWAADRILNNPKTDYAADALKSATHKFESADKLFAAPASPRPVPPLAPLAGDFVNAGIGKAVVALEGDALVMTLQATGARLKLTPWDGDIFTANLMREGRFAAVDAMNGPAPSGFVQFPIDPQAKKIDRLRFSFDDGQAYDFQRQ